MESIDMLFVLLVGNMLLSLITIIWLVIVSMKVISIKKEVDSFPNPYLVVEEAMKNKIPVLMGPDGMPVMGSMTPPASQRNPMVG